MLEIHHGDNLEIMQGMADSSVNLFYIDPPFNTGRIQNRKILKTIKDIDGDRKGFNGRLYKTTELSDISYNDKLNDKYYDFLIPRLQEAYRLLAPTGSFFFHIDYRESHYCKIVLDEIFDSMCFINEIIWAYDYGGRPKNRWPCKHDTIFWYAKDPLNYTFNYDEIDRIPYLAPSLVGDEKAERGKTPTDVWWNTIVPTNGKEKTGYPTQKPMGILERIIRVHSNPGDVVMDFFAGSGTTGDAALKFDRKAILIDNNEQAINIMMKRFYNEKSIRVPC